MSNLLKSFSNYVGLCYRTDSSTYLSLTKKEILTSFVLRTITQYIDKRL